MATFSERLAKAMLIRGLKNAQLAQRSGVSKGTISNYLSGRYEAKQNNVYKLALALNVDEAWLMGKDVPMARSAISPLYGALKQQKTVECALTSDEIRMLNAYRELPEDTQQSILSLLEAYHRGGE